MPRKTRTPSRSAKRAHAGRSTGPRTPEGKHRTRRNALKHGLLSREVVIAMGDGAEDGRDFHTLLRDLEDELKPEGLIEETLVERIATCYWRLRRAQRYEVGAIRESLDECGRPEGRSVTWPTVNLELQLEKARARLDSGREVAKALRELRDPGDPEAQAKIRQELEQLAADHRLDVTGLSLAGLQALVTAAQDEFVGELQATVDRLGAKVEAAHHYDELRRSRRALTGCLPAEGSLLKLVRYETMLDRQLHRALIELRRRRAADNPPHHPISDSTSLQKM